MARTESATAPALRLSPRSLVMVVIAGVTSLVAFGWPLLVNPSSTVGTHELAPLLLVLVVPLVLAVVTAEVTGDRADVKALAMLGVLSAVVAVVRPLGGGTAGLETVFLPIIIAGRVFGPGFGFVLGNTGLFASALITGAIGPWLPYQMLASGFVGLLAGVLPQLRGRAELVMLAGFSFVAAFVYGWLIDFSFWPFAVGTDTQISYQPGAPAWQNLQRFFWFNVATSMGWNLGRALTTMLLLVVLGPAFLRILRRAARRASFTSQPFEE